MWQVKDIKESEDLKNDMCKSIYNLLLEIMFALHYVLCIYSVCVVALCMCSNLVLFFGICCS